MKNNKLKGNSRQYNVLISYFREAIWTIYDLDLALRELYQRVYGLNLRSARTHAATLYKKIKDIGIAARYFRVNYYSWLYNKFVDQTAPCEIANKKNIVAEMNKEIKRTKNSFTKNF